MEGGIEEDAVNSVLHVRIHVKEGSWADNNFDNWFNKDPKYTKVYD